MVFRHEGSNTTSEGDLWRVIDGWQDLLPESAPKHMEANQPRPDVLHRAMRDKVIRNRFPAKRGSPQTRGSPSRALDDKAVMKDARLLHVCNLLHACCSLVVVGAQYHSLVN